MKYSDTLRILILSSPTSISDLATTLSYSIEQLFTNFVFLAFISTILGLFVFIFITIIIRKRREPTVLLTYVLGFTLFYIALNFKLLISFFGSKIENIDSKLYSALESLTKNSNSSFWKTALASILTALQKSGDISEYESNKILSINNQIESMSLTGENHLRSTENLSNSFAIDEFKEKLENGFLELRSSLKENERDTRQLKGQNSNLKTVNKTSEANNENPNLEVKLDNQQKLRISIKENRNRRDGESMPGDIGEIKNRKDSREPAGKNSSELKEAQLDKKTSSNKQKGVKNSANFLTTREPNVMLRYKIPDVGKNATLDDRENQYFKKVLNIFEFEFTTNMMIQPKLKEINKMLDATENEIVKLDSDIKKLISLGLIIDKEMRSFNVFIEKYDSLRVEMTSNLSKFMSLRSLNENLNVKQGSDKSQNPTLKSRSEHSKTLKSPTNINNSSFSGNTLVQWLLIIEFIFFIFFLYLTLIGADIYIFKLLGCIFFALNALVGISFMIYANFFDKDCILGRVPGCNSIFSKNFTEFAKSANIDLKPLQKAKIGSLRDKLDQIKSKTGSSINILTTFFEEDYLSEFSKHNLIFMNLIDKIKFVQDDFDELTHSKVDRKQFFLLLESIQSRLVQMNVNLKLLDRKFMFEFYTRESIFSNFIALEKESILESVEKQMEGTNQQINKQKKIECGRLLSKMCEQKNALDNLSVLMIVGSVILGICLIF